MTASTAERLAALPRDQRNAIIDQLSPEEQEALLYDWREFLARPEQITPEGDWDIWLIMSGRGWGKTRTGAEWVKEQVAKGYRRIALIGETAADARDVMVEGVSGILSVYPEAERPLYEPSKRRLTWPNGAVATTFNATEPDQLRGPQFDLAWCFIAGTMIETNRGAIPIEQVTDRDMVMTQLGWRRVECNGSRIAEIGTVKFSTGAVLTGTADHPVLSLHGETMRWTALSELQTEETVCALSAWNGAVNAGTDTETGITNIAEPNHLAARIATDCTALSGKRITGQFRTGSTFTTLTTTALTMLWKTFSFCHDQITCATTSLVEMISRQSMSPRLQSVASAAQSWSGAPAGRPYADAANRSKLTSAARSSGNARSATRHSGQSAETIAASVVSTWEPAGHAEVFCLQVSEAKHYFANGILVHNCDELAKWRYARETWDQLSFGLRLGDHPRVLVTTTPRPVELVKAIVAGTEGKVHITRGATMDNKSNLAAKFLERIQLRYEGTRLGRQELRGEILGDIPNALWTYGQIEASRVRAHDPLGRIVVAIDPAVSNTENSDDHGIIVAGIHARTQEAYVLEDASMGGTPMQWARRAVNLYDQYQADAIVIEVNQGGDMVAQTLRSVRNNVRIKEVRATRGKHIRAEPIASMYEQGRVHHVGSFPALETQMTQMTTFGYEGDGSPDRVDALVWAMTDLFPAMVGRPVSQRITKPVPIVTPLAR
jgi:phage terminase large subunit-like protein